MNDTLQYKGLVGSVQFSADDMLFYGKILGIDDLVNYHGTSVKELTDAFHEAVDDYLETCAQEGKEPGKTYKGLFNVRVSPEMHKDAALFAAKLNITLNDLVKTAMYFALDHEELIRKKVQTRKTY